MFLTKHNSLETHVDNKFITSSAMRRNEIKKKLKYAQPLNARHFDCVLLGNQNGNLSFKLTLTEEET